MTTLGCVVIAVLLWLIVPSLGQYGLVSTLVHSEFIGLSIACLCLLMRRYVLPDPQSRLLDAIAIAICIIIGLIVGLVLARLSLGRPLRGEPWIDEPVGIAAILSITLLASIGFVTHFGQRATAVALTASAAEDARRADAARLSMLRAQLDPHMLFNTLANLRALIATDPERAEKKMIDHLVPFLRATLDGSRENHWTLAREFDELQHYLEIMEIRLAPRLSFDLKLPKQVSDCEVPALLLQPIVENAVRHGIEPSLRGGHIHISAERSGSSILVTIKDSVHSPKMTPTKPNRDNIWFRERARAIAPRLVRESEFNYQLQ